MPDSFDPNRDGALGRWFCRGTHLVSGAQFPTTARAVHTGQLYMLPRREEVDQHGGSGGQRPGGSPRHRRHGPFKDYVGEQKQELLGFNASGGVNLRVSLVLKRATR